MIHSVTNPHVEGKMCVLKMLTTNECALQVRNLTQNFISNERQWGLSQNTHTIYGRQPGYYTTPTVSYLRELFGSW